MASRRRAGLSRTTVALVACAAGLAAGLMLGERLGPESWFDRRPRVEIVRDGTAASPLWPLTTEHWTEEKLRVLAIQEGLDELAPRDAKFLEIVHALVPWTSRQWTSGIPDPYPRSNALDILADIRAGTTSGFCGQYAYVLADALKAVGLFAVRYCELQSRSGSAHFAVEAWSDDHQKWVLLDPWLNVYYTTADGAPLSALELHDLAVARTFGEARVVQLEPRPTKPRIEELEANGLAYYFHLAVSTRSDYMRHPDPVTMLERQTSFVYYDDPEVPPEARLDLYWLRSSRRQDFAYAMNQVYLEVEAAAPDRVVVQCTTRRSAPNFRGFQWRREGLAWRDLDGARLVVTPSTGPGRYEVRTRNAFDRYGAPSAFTVEF